MTNQKQDAIIAGAIEEKPFDWAKTISPGGAWFYEGYWKPRTFISAPTWELEGIVLKAYKKNALFWGHVWIILRERQVGTTGIKMSARRLDVDSIDLMRHYKVGDWALALLEVLRETAK